MPRAQKGQSSSSPRKPKSPRATKVKGTDSPKSPGLKQLREAWNASLPEPWIPNENEDFVHPEGISTEIKGEIAKKYKLNPREIATLPYEQRLSRSGFMMHLYSKAQLSDLSSRKRAKLMLDPLPAPVSALRMPDWMEPMLPPPLKIESYTCPPGAAKPDPEEITWTPRKLSGSVAVEDACRLYCITAEQIQDLSNASQWIDLGTVARRAVTLHGGFYAHEAIVRRARYEEERMLTEVGEDESRFRFSPLIHKQYDPDIDSRLYDPRPLPKNPVAVHYPILYDTIWDHGGGSEWHPSWGSF
ncbi:hypothetical protein C8R46DRAFT_1084234 [Mycena filopes]|nr:hypothetical protein C8R46DRAFT_1084234 [Mycena filopes]